MKAASSFRFIISFSFVDERAERREDEGEGRGEGEGHCTLKRPTCIQGHPERRECADMGVFLLQKKKNMDDTTTVSTLTVCLFLLVFFFSFLDHQSSLLITPLFDFIPFVSYTHSLWVVSSWEGFCRRD